MAGTATFVATDSTTQGDWIGAYGSQGYGIACGVDATTDAIVAPTGATVTLTVDRFRYDGASSDAKALQYPSGVSRVSAVWFDTPTIDIEITDGTTRNVALYFWDAVDNDRAQTITVYSVTGATTTVIETRNIAAGFGTTPVYLRWTCSGHVRFIATHTAGTNAIINGYFIGLGTPKSAYVFGKNGSVSSDLTFLANLDSEIRTVDAPGSLAVGGNVAYIAQASAPTAVAGMVLLFAEDDGSGKLRLMAQFPTGAAKQIEIET